MVTKKLQIKTFIKYFNLLIVNATANYASHFNFFSISLLHTHCYLVGALTFFGHEDPTLSTRRPPYWIFKWHFPHSPERIGNKSRRQYIGVLGQKCTLINKFNVYLKTLIRYVLTIRIYSLWKCPPRHVVGVPFCWYRLRQFVAPYLLNLIAH